MFVCVQITCKAVKFFEDRPRDWLGCVGAGSGYRGGEEEEEEEENSDDAR